MDLSETLVFIVPLRPKRGASEWHAVQQALQQTLRSVKGSTRQDFLVVLLGMRNRIWARQGILELLFLECRLMCRPAPKKAPRT